MPEEYAVTDQFDGGLDHPIYRIEYCRNAVRDHFGDAFDERFQPEPGRICASIQDDDGFVHFQHSFEGDTEKQELRDTIEVTGCEVVAETAVYRSEYGIVESLVYAVPGEWVGTLDFDFDADVESFRTGDHLGSPPPTKPEAKAEFYASLRRIGIILAFLPFIWLQKSLFLEPKRSLTTLESIVAFTADVTLFVLPFMVLVGLAAKTYPKYRVYRDASVA